MAADISRIRSNPLLDFAGVELKQGGVLLDADFNELVALIDRRLRATASDVLGAATVSSTTPDAFKIAVQAGTLSIGRGRLYVDGLLAECHGGPSDDPARKQLDPLMGETLYPDPLTYAKQPFQLLPPTLPSSGRHLVYLDVWQREVTHIERPDLVEIAVGVETSSRLQTVWQVRVLADAAGTADCATADGGVPGWATITAPSVARLSTGTFQAPPGSGDPCELPPTGGYRGLENQTYRMEIHDPGLPGAGATFKWSRDNASVASRVASVVSSVDTLQQSRSVLELVNLGRDDVLRFNTRDWVEITDDVREQAQRGGEMRRVTVDDAARTITFSPALPADLLPTGALPNTAFALARNLRVRRWDHKGQVLRVNANGSTSLHQDLDAASSTGVINVPTGGGTLLLENGITVSFTAATGSGRFRAADHWVFSARTADATVELLANEPPCGIHHHYARLGFWDVATGQVSDCRRKWPPVVVGDGGHGDCGCTVCVTPQSHRSGTLTIQAAVDQVSQRGGGTVCIALGEYLLDAPVQVNRSSSLRIRGEGPGTVLVGLKGGGFRLKNCTAVVIEDLAVLSAGEADAIHAETSIGLCLQRLAVLVFGDHSKIAAIGLSRIAVSATVRDNVILAPLGIAAGDFDTVNLAAASIELRSGFLMTGSLRIEDNVLACARCGVDMTGLVLHMLANEIRGNEILGCSEDAIRLLGLNAPQGSMRVETNMISVHGHGITAGVDGLWIEGNKLHATRANVERHTGAGIRLMAGLDSNGPSECQILANQIRGFDGGGVLAGSRSAELIIKLNIISRCGYGIWLQDESATGRASIENNHLSDIGMDSVSTSTAAIAVSRVDTAAVSGNTIARVGMKAEQAPLVVGIFAVGVDRLRLAGNSITDIGPPGGAARSMSVGVAVAEPFVQTDVAYNQIDRESTPQSPGSGQFQALWIDELHPAAGGGMGMGLGSGHLSATAGQMTVVFGSNGAYVSAHKEGDAPAHASVQGNSLSARGALPVARVQVSGDCLFSDNRCELRGDGDKKDAVQLRGNAAIVNANRVRGGEVSIRIHGQTRSLAVLGNITTGAIMAPAPWPGPWAQFNVLG